MGLISNRSIFSAFFSFPPLIYQLAFFVFPLFFLLVLSFWSVKFYRVQPDFTFSNWLYIFEKGYFWKSYGWTFSLAAMTSIIASVIAFPASYYISFKLSENIKRIVLLSLIVPFFTSYLVRIYSWQVFLNDNGIINAALDYIGVGAVAMINTKLGSVIGYLTLSLPLVILLQVFSLSNIDRNLVEAAHNLKCSPLKTIFLVVIPAARVGLVLAALFCFILSFGDFVSPIYLGGATTQTLSILIIDLSKAGQQWPRAAVVAITMIVTLLATTFLALRFAYKGKS
ncbi:ABC transporter permease [Dasania sp. GY-MA-18]|uniref:ABC transporter permease n=1 Tax=Dasania phycosphaerae TaxID=2950436 RepID=A0A9J6RNN6_9GAMM|nr:MULTISPECIES: ABC transporter permease [Dasania]MCR8923495.1 ABC transporter permease [Dasania sp. GY-MA-18]MCZ0865929.1 ABC transporter permease [Dasania phycosphaerae]MCZ0869653.1 ABC transporter permease [Dasania phycosphaerae]